MLENHLRDLDVKQVRRAQRPFRVERVIFHCCCRQWMDSAPRDRPFRVEGKLRLLSEDDTPT